jgi:nicotinamidase-related amidase
MSITALLLIDFQNDYFQGGKYPLSGTEAAAEKGAQIVAAFRDKKLPVVHVRHEFPTEDAPFFTPGSEGAKIHPSLAPIEGEPVVSKFQINGFRDTNLKEVLDKAKVENLVIVGAMSHMCIDAVVRAANDYGYQCSVAHDACATLDLEFNGTTVSAKDVHAAFMAALAFAYANVATTEDIIAAL